MESLESRVERLVRARRRAIALLLLALIGSVATSVGMIFFLANKHRREQAEAEQEKAAKAKLPIAPAPVVAPQQNSPPAPEKTAPHVENAAPATVTGVVRLKGAVPPRELLKMATDPWCAKKWGEDDAVLVGKEGALSNAIVHVVVGPTMTAPPPSEKVTLDQDGCRYRPRVSALVVGQKLEIRNGDETLHNIHGWAGARTLFNNAMVAHAPPVERTFAEPGIVKLKCDVHPWMTGFVLVQPNGFFAVTGADGRFTLRGLPPGQYTVEAWHERFGTRTAELTLAAGASATSDFDFAVDQP